MKKVINGKLYDTETAVLIGEYSSGYSSNDFNSYNEALYLSPKGTYFLAGEGGPMTSYAQSVADYIVSGSDIIPLTREEAREWAEGHLLADEVIEHFDIQEG